MSEAFKAPMKSSKSPMEAFVAAYEGVTVAGVLPVRYDGEVQVFLAQRAYDETDDEAVRETWEAVGGHLGDGEEPFAAATREFAEEIGFDLPDGEVLNGWRSEDDHYQGFVYEPYSWPASADWTPTEEVQAVGWFTLGEARGLLNLRPEVAAMDLEALVEQDVSGNGIAAAQVDEEVSGNEAEVEDDLTDDDFVIDDLVTGPIKIHGVLAPEGVESGDGREFKEYALTRRSPLRLPFNWQKTALSGHDGSVVVGSIDVMMRDSGGLIHWEGELLSTEEASELMDLLVHFGKFGVSIDGDKASMDNDVRDKMLFDAARVAGATACAIPAFQEAYVSLGPHPTLPTESTSEVMVAGARAVALGPVDATTAGLATFKRGKGWVTNPKETRRLHRYWTEPGQPGYAKIRWGTPGDWTRCTVLVGEKIAKNSPEKMRYIKQICSQWHNDALGYWPGEYDRPGNPQSKDKVKAGAGGADDESAVEAAEGIEPDSEGLGWEAVLVSSAAVAERVYAPADYFTRHPNTGALVVEDPDENGFRRTYGYVAQWGVCHIGYDGQCVEVPDDPTGEFPEFHLGRTRVDSGEYLNTGLITYKTEHRDAQTLLTQTAEQAHFDNIAHAWAAIRLGNDENGVWFSGVVLPGVPEADITLIEAAGQVSGEWKYGALRGLQCVSIPGFPVMRSSAAYDDEGNVVALVAGAHTQESDGGCAPTPTERMRALAQVDAEIRFQKLRDKWGGTL